MELNEQQFNEGIDYLIDTNDYLNITDEEFLTSLRENFERFLNEEENILNENIFKNTKYKIRWSLFKFSLRFLRDDSLTEILKMIFESKNRKEDISKLSHMNKKEKLKELFYFLNRIDEKNRIHILDNINIPYDKLAASINKDNNSNIDYNDVEKDDLNREERREANMMTGGGIVLGIASIIGHISSLAILGLTMSILFILTGATVSAVTPKKIKDRIKIENKEKIIQYLKGDNSEKFEKDRQLPSVTLDNGKTYTLMSDLQSAKQKISEVFARSTNPKKNFVITFDRLIYEKKDGVIHIVEAMVSIGALVRLKFEGKTIKQFDSLAYEAALNAFKPIRAVLDKRTKDNKNYNLFIGSSLFDPNGKFIKDTKVLKTEFDVGPEHFEAALKKMKNFTPVNY